MATHIVSMDHHAVDGTNTFHVMDLHQLAPPPLVSEQHHPEEHHQAHNDHHHQQQQQQQHHHHHPVEHHHHIHQHQEQQQPQQPADESVGLQSQEPNGMMAVMVHQPGPDPSTLMHQPQQQEHDVPQPILGVTMAQPDIHQGVAPTRYKRHWLSTEQIAKVDEAFEEWKGNWRGKEPQLKALAAELGITVEKLKKRVDYMRRRRESKALGNAEGGDLLSEDGFGDDGSGIKRPRPSGTRRLPSRAATEPFHPPKCLFSHTGCLSTAETGGQVMIVVTPGCGHRWVCLACFHDPYKVDDYLKLTGCCPTCRETTLVDRKPLITIAESELTKQACKWCRVKNRNMAFTPCAHVSEYCIDCFDQAGNGYYAKEEICTTCEQKYTKTLQL